MNQYKWQLSMHGRDTVETGTIRAKSLKQATEMAMVAAFGDIEHVALPDEHKPGYVHWAGEFEGSTTLTVALDTAAEKASNLARFWVRATLPAPIVVGADGEPLDEFLWKPYVPIQGSPGEWWFSGEYVRGQTPKPVVIGVVDAPNEESIQEHVEKMFGAGVVVDSAVPRHAQWRPQSTINGINAYPTAGDGVTARVRKGSRTTPKKSSGDRLSKSELAGLERSLGLGNRPKRNRSDAT